MVVRHVADLMGLEPGNVLYSGKSRQAVVARSLVCYWARQGRRRTFVPSVHKIWNEFYFIVILFRQDLPRLNSLRSFLSKI
jgi:hypothetical protein